MPVLLVALRFIAIVAIQIVAFFFFYNHPHGKHAVYRTWYAWIIDVLAIVSGMVIMTLSVFSLYNPWIFTIEIPDVLFWITFIVGSWQAVIHAVKLVIRMQRERE